jgi:hypothetical protein
MGINTRRLRLFGILLLCIFTLIGIQQTRYFGPVSSEIRRNLCLYIEGQWAPAQDRCITRSCYSRHDCGVWLHPSCSRVRIGDPISEVYFRLGEATGTNGDEYWWCVGKPDCPLRIVAQIEAGTLKKLDCP